MIVEIRTCKAKRGSRPYVLEMIRSRMFEELKRIGGKCAGPWASTMDDQTIVWLRGFADEEQRQIMSNQFYGGAFWEEEMADLIQPNIDGLHVVVVEMAENAVMWD